MMDWLQNSNAYGGREHGDNAYDNVNDDTYDAYSNQVMCWIDYCIMHWLK